MLSWPSSHRIRYRGDGSPRTTSSTTPERGRRSVDSDSATTRLPTSKAMLTPSVFVLAEHSRRQASATTTSGQFPPPERCSTALAAGRELDVQTPRCGTPEVLPSVGVRCTQLVDRG